MKSAKASILALTFALLVAAATAGIVNSQTSNGKYDTDGDGLVEISNLEQLDAMRHDLDVDGFPDSDSGASAYEAAFPVTGAEVVCANNCTGYELTRSLDFDDAASYASGAVNPEWTTGGGWLPGGLGTTFDGNGNTISNLYINRTGSDATNVGLNVGLFSNAARSSVIRSIGLVDMDVTSSSLSRSVGVGGLVGRNAGTISDSYVTGSVSGTVTGFSIFGAGVGGLIGIHSAGTINDVYATGSVNGTLTAAYGSGTKRGGVGGLVGYVSSGAISGSHVTSSVTGTLTRISDGGVGGLVGLYYGTGTISDVYATGSVEGSGALGVGGLVGRNSGNISESHATSSVTGNAISIRTGSRLVYGGVGGLVGHYSSGSISNSHATGNVEGSGSGGVGGLVGDFNSSGNISESYATGTVTGSPTYVGGLAGRNRGNISESYATGTVTGTGAGVGGLVGEHSSGTIRRSHATGSVERSGPSSGAAYVGGLVGINAATIAHTHATGSVTGTNAWAVGGLVGFTGAFFPTLGFEGARLSRSYATGNVTGTNAAYVGGLVGLNVTPRRSSLTNRLDYVASISTSYATGSVEGSESKAVGGLVGYSGFISPNSDYTGSRASISVSYATGSVTGTVTTGVATSGEGGVGGLVGSNSYSDISASYATGSVTGTVTSSGEGSEGGVGGLVGSNSYSDISASYATGSVTGTVTSSGEGSEGGVGGLVGSNSYSDINDSFWDTETSGQPTGSGVGSGSSTGLLGRTTAQLQAPTGYTGIYRNWGDVDRWDFGTSSQYPVLKVDFDGDRTATWQEFGSQRGDMPALPGAPTGLTATSNGTTQIDLSWSAPSSDGGAAITGYRIEVSADGSTWSDLAADTGSTGTSYSHTGLTAGTTRHYRVSAVSSAGTGAASTVASATTTSDQAGTVTLSTMRPVVGAELTATLGDPDGGVTDVTWQWARSLDETTSWADIAGATSMSYTPTSIDAGYYLRATATYTDPLASGKTARGVSDYAVTEGDSLIDRYDTNNNGIIEKNEVIKAINDYLFGEEDQAISKSDVIKLINLYLFG